MRPIGAPQGAFRYPLSAIFRTEASVRVLRELAQHGGALDTGRVMRAAGITRQTVLASLEHLEALGMVLPVGTGRYRSYQANTAHPLFGPIEDLFAAEAARVQRAHDAVQRAAAASAGAVTAVWVYGSVARGEDGPTSDLDLAIVVGAPEPIQPIINAFREAIGPMEEAEHIRVSVVGISDADVLRLSAGDPWWVTMERDAIPLVGDHPSDYARRTRGATKRSTQGRVGRPGRSSTNA